MASAFTELKKRLRGKTVTLMGLGILGRGVGDAAFLAPLVKHLIVTDMKTEAQLASSVKKLAKYKNVTFRLGGHMLQDFSRTDLVVYAAGVPFNSEYLAHARQKNIEVTMSTALCVKAVKQAGVKVVGITGTRGKSTVTHLIYHILLSRKGKNAPAVYLGGNVLGISTLALSKKLKHGDVLVLELDSWQLQGFGLEKISPDVGVFTTFMPDHQNYYAGSMQQYFDDKAFIYRNMSKEDVLVCGSDMKPQFALYDKKKPHSNVVYVPKKTALAHQLIGAHNDYNVSIAVATAEVLGVPHTTIARAVKSFRGVSGRLEMLGSSHGIIWINDTTATTPQAALAGVRAVKDSLSAQIVLIGGGAHKELEVLPFVEACSLAKDAVLFSGTGTEKVLQHMRESAHGAAKDIPLANSMHEAITYAYAKALELRNKGAQKVVIMLSPGFASFGMFKNEYDRGDQFNAEAKKYI